MIIYTLLMIWLCDSFFIGNLDERVNERVLYDILIQAGRVVDLYIPRDKETDRPKGYAFAEYETEEVAEYAVRLFSGLVTLYNRTLKFAVGSHWYPSLAEFYINLFFETESSLEDGFLALINSVYLWIILFLLENTLFYILLQFFLGCLANIYRKH